MKALIYGLSIALWIGCGGMAVADTQEIRPTVISRTDYKAQEQPKDWLNLSDVSIENQHAQSTRAIIAPLHGATVYQSPPDFTWAWADYNYGDLTYQIELRYPTGRTETLNTDKTFLSGWPGSLSTNIEPYWWRVRAFRQGKVHKDWGQWRAFYVSSNALHAGEHDIDTLYKTAASKSRPRTFPTEAALEALQAKYIGDNAPFKIEWLAFANKAWGGIDAVIANNVKVASASSPAVDINLIVKTAFAWKITEDASYLEETKRRLLNMASWDPDTNGTRCDWNTAGQNCRAMVVNMAIVYDWLYDELTVDERETVKQAIMAKFPQTNAQNLGFAHYTKDIFYGPLESWASNALTQMVIVTSLMAGEDDVFENHFKSHMPYYLTKGQLWGNDDGGYGNGMSYGAIDINTTMMGFYVIGQTTGYDLSRKQYFNNLPYYWLYFQPPVSAERMYSASTRTWMPGVFGDGAEEPIMSYYLKSAVNAFVSHLYKTVNQTLAPSIRWYANQLNATANARVSDWVWMINPVEKSDSQDVLSDKLYSSALFPTVGEVAIHSDLADVERTSIYFRSSLYGSQGHNHADQNSFVVHAGGVPLLIDSGYYDGYQSNHYNNWYKQTKAHNAITFDGGQGQRFDSRTATGQITRYFYDTTAGDLTEVVADATTAYNGELTEAKRTLLYSKHGILIVHDKVSSDISRTWEWNLHAANEIEVLSNNEVKITNQGKTACIAMYSLSPVTFSQTNQFGDDAALSSHAPQWHGRFSTLGAGKSNEFLSVIRVGCGKAPSVTPTKYGWQVYFAPRSFNVQNGEVSYKLVNQ